MVHRRGRRDRDGARVRSGAGGFTAAGERRASSVGLACAARSSRSDSAVSGSRSRVGELVGVLERACELVAFGGCFTERFNALVVRSPPCSRAPASVSWERLSVTGCWAGRPWIVRCRYCSPMRRCGRRAVRRRRGGRRVARPLVRPASDGPEVGRERAGRVGAVRVGVIVDVDREQITAGVAHPRERLECARRHGA